jgi:hypothetical protein
MTLNEAKWAFLNAAIGKPGHINELESQWLVAQGATPGKSLNEKWHEVFNQPNKSWNEAAHAWLDVQGIPQKRTLNERFYLFWTAP